MKVGDGDKFASLANEIFLQAPLRFTSMTPSPSWPSLIPALDRFRFCVAFSHLYMTFQYHICHFTSVKPPIMERVGGGMRRLFPCYSNNTLQITYYPLCNFVQYVLYGGVVVERRTCDQEVMGSILGRAHGVKSTKTLGKFLTPMCLCHQAV